MSGVQVISRGVLVDNKGEKALCYSLSSIDPGSQTAPTIPALMRTERCSKQTLIRDQAGIRIGNVMFTLPLMKSRSTSSNPNRSVASLLSLVIALH